MSTNVTVTLPDDVYQQVAQLARLANLEVNEVLAEAIELSLLPGTSQRFAAKPVTALSDKEVLKLARLQMSPAEDRRFSQLLHRQQSGSLAPEHRTELLGLMQAYGNGLLRKAQALSEAVRRGLRAPLAP
jgi:hypothetical protein